MKFSHLMSWEYSRLLFEKKKCMYGNNSGVIILQIYNYFTNFFKLKLESVTLPVPPPKQVKYPLRHRNKFSPMEQSLSQMNKVTHKLKSQ